MGLFVFLLISIIPLIFYFLKRKYDYWSNRGFPYVEPKFLKGNIEGMGTTRAFGEVMLDCYKDLKGKGPVGGIYLYTEPAAIIMDMDLLRNVLVKDFQYFHDRGMYINEKDDPLSAHLFSIEGSQWRNLRNKLSPTFTSGKLKMMHPTMISVADQFVDHLNGLCKGSVVQLEMKELLSQFTTDIIGNVAFGVNCNSMKDPHSEFRRIGRKIIEPSSWTLFVQIFVTMFPKLGKFLHMKLNDQDVTEFFMKLLSETIKYRKENNVQRNDFLSMLIQIMNTGKLEGEADDLGKMTFNELAAQVFLFFFAGFETSSSTMTFVLYEMALNLDIQEKARREIKEVIERHGGELTYDAAMELKYVDQIIQESLRKYPIVDTQLRKTSAAYKVPGTELVLEKGTTILLPAIGFHHDPEIFPNPEKFDPERFTKENIGARHPYAWFPFGKGPRDCIGMRFGMMQTRLGVATVLKNFLVTTSEKTLIPMKFQPDAQVLNPVGGMFLNLEAISEENNN